MYFLFKFEDNKVEVVRSDSTLLHELFLNAKGQEHILLKFAGRYENKAIFDMVRFRIHAGTDLVNVFRKHGFPFNRKTFGNRETPEQLYLSEDEYDHFIFMLALVN